MLRAFRVYGLRAGLILGIFLVVGATMVSAQGTVADTSSAGQGKETLTQQHGRKAMTEQKGAGGMSLLQAAVLGVVEGVTEYLPVSSTGHLLLAQRAMGIGEGLQSSGSGEDERAKEAADAYAICIQAGAIIAVLGLYLRRVKEMLMGLAGRNPAGLRMVWNVAAGFLPAAVIGLFFNKVIKAYLFGPWPVVVAWFVGGVAILGVGWLHASRGKQVWSGKSMDELRVRMALMVGFAQCLAMWPGVSRSLITIVGGLMVGLSMSAALEFSFLLGLVTLGAATAYDALKHGHAMLQIYDVSALTVGLVVAFVSAIVTVKWMVSYLNRHGLALFGYYRVALALVVTVLLVTKVL
jgi:undecaprenyl-diphosphatase